MATKKREHAAALKLPPLWDRLQGQIDWYDAKAKANQRYYKASKIAIIVCAIIIPIVAEVLSHGGDRRRRHHPPAREPPAGSTNGRRTGSSTARPARACATSSISTTRRQALTPSCRPTRRTGCWPSGSAR